MKQNLNSETLKNNNLIDCDSKTELMTDFYHLGLHENISDNLNRFFVSIYWNIRSFVMTTFSSKKTILQSDS